MDKAMVDIKDLEDSESIASNDQSFEARFEGIKSKLNTKQMKLEVSESPKGESKSMQRRMSLRDLEDSESIASNDRSFEDIERVIKSKLNMMKVEVSESLKKDSKIYGDLEASESIASLKEDSKSMSMSLRDLEDSESIASNSIQEENPTRMSFRAKFSSDSTSSLVDENLTPFQVALSSELKEVAKSKAHLSTDDNFDYDGDEGTSSGDSDSVFYKEIPLQKSFKHKFEPRRQFDQVPRSEQMSTPDQKHQELLFDSHCHIDRILSRAFNKPASAFFKPGPQPLQLLKETYTVAFTSTFEGCINVVTHPNQFDTKFWDWLDEPEMYLAIGCHPENSKSYDLIAEETLKESLEHPKVIALGEIGLDDVWEKRGISFETQKEVNYSTV